MMRLDGGGRRTPRVWNKKGDWGGLQGGVKLAGRWGRCRGGKSLKFTLFKSAMISNSLYGNFKNKNKERK